MKKTTGLILTGLASFVMGCCGAQHAQSTIDSRTPEERARATCSARSIGEKARALHNDLVLYAQPAKSGLCPEYGAYSVDEASGDAFVLAARVANQADCRQQNDKETIADYQRLQRGLQREHTLFLLPSENGVQISYININNPRLFHATIQNIDNPSLRLLEQFEPPQKIIREYSDTEAQQFASSLLQHGCVLMETYKNSRDK